jgi:hypothetical protein
MRWGLIRLNCIIILNSSLFLFRLNIFRWYMINLLEYLFVLLIFKSVKKNPHFSVSGILSFSYSTFHLTIICVWVCVQLSFLFNIIMNWTNFTHRTYIVFTMKDYLSNLRDCWNVRFCFFKGEINLYKSSL